MQNLSFLICALFALPVLTVRRSGSDNDTVNQEAVNNNYDNISPKTKSKLLSRQALSPDEKPPENKPPPGNPDEKPPENKPPPGNPDEKPPENKPPPGNPDEKPPENKPPPGNPDEKPPENKPPPGNPDETPPENKPPPGNPDETPPENKPPPGNPDETPPENKPPPGNPDETPPENKPPPGNPDEKLPENKPPPGNPDEKPPENKPPPGNPDETPPENKPPPGNPDEKLPENKPPPGNPDEKPPENKPPPGNADEKPPDEKTPPLGLKPTTSHIVLIVADDLGWDDVSYHGSEQIYTPNIDALALNGVRLENYYTLPLCTPSRVALLSGRQPSKVGMQRLVILPGAPYGLPLKYQLLPEYLKGLNYTTHLVGKWHLGSHLWDFWPTRRGFDTFFGYVGAQNDYLDHTHGNELSGYDLWHNELLVATKYVGNHSANLFNARAKQIILDHPKDKPLFLMFSPQNVHTGNFFDQLQVPPQLAEVFSNIKDIPRKKFTGLIKGLDDLVGNIVQALNEAQLLDNTYIFFATDNGGVPYGRFQTVENGYGSNWPLRGGKGNFWEGGIRGAAFVWSKLFNESIRGSERNELMHITDLLPTIYHCAGGQVSNLPGDLDGLDQWDTISSTDSKAQRTELVLVYDGKTVAYRQGKYKLVKGPTLFKENSNGWYPPPGRVAKQGSPAEKVDRSKLPCTLCKALGITPDYSKVHPVICKKSGRPTKCTPVNENCLFDLQNDPCEYNNIAASNQPIVVEIERKIQEFSKSVVKPLFRRKDPACNPSYPAYAWWPCKEPKLFIPSNYIATEKPDIKARSFAAEGDLDEAYAD